MCSKLTLRVMQEKEEDADKCGHIMLALYKFT